MIGDLEILGNKMLQNANELTQGLVFLGYLAHKNKFGIPIKQNIVNSSQRKKVLYQLRMNAMNGKLKTAPVINTVSKFSFRKLFGTIWLR